ncbi:hypothetical protein JCM8097_002478 [Rhodosporidiobolus ruineniae]
MGASPTPSSQPATSASASASATAVSANPLFLSQPTPSSTPLQPSFDSATTQQQQQDSLDDQSDTDQLADSPAPDTSSSHNAQQGPGPASQANRVKAGGSNAAQIAKAQATKSTPVKSKKTPRASTGGASSSSTPARASKYVPPPLPHHHVERHSGTKADPHVIVIHDGVSDANRARHPTQAERDPNRVDDKGNTNHYEVQRVNDPKYVMWRSKLGNDLAQMLGVKGKTAGGKDEVWVINQLPTDYLLTIRYTVTAAGAARKDVYCFGSPKTLHFRTSNEFIAHLYWLLMHGPNDTLACRCSYCKGTTQTAVNADLGLETHSTSPGASTKAKSTTPGATAASKPSRTAEPARYEDDGGERLLGSEEARKKEKKRRASALADAAAGPAKKPKPTSSLAKSALKAEELDGPPTYDGAYTNRQRDADLSDLAAHRIDDLVWAELPTPLVSSDPERAHERITHWPGIVTNRTPRVEAAVKGQLELGEPTPKDLLAVTQSWAYEVRLLAVTDELQQLRGDQVRAWLAHPPPTTLWYPERMMHKRAMELVWDAEAKKTRRDCSVREDVKCLEAGVTALALAMQVAAHIVGSFTLNDRYKIDAEHIKVPDVPSASSSSSAAAPLSARDLPLQRHSWSFQSLDWGAERIWAGDLVRLLTRPDADGTLENPAGLDDARGRCWFMKVAAIYKDAETGRARVAGEVVELRDAKGGEDEAGAGPREAAPVPDGAGGAADGGGEEKKENGAAEEKEQQGPYPASAASVSHLLPRAPDGYVFHVHTPADQQVHADAEHIGGRYHPLPPSLDRREVVERLLVSPALTECEAEGVGGGGSAASIPWEERAVVLAGLTPSFRLYMKCGTWRPTRFEQIIEAEKIAAREVASYFAKVDVDGSTSSVSGSDDRSSSSRSRTSTPAIQQQQQNGVVKNGQALGRVNGTEDDEDVEME